MGLKLVLVGPRGTVFKDGTATAELLQGLVDFIKRMHAVGVKVALWSRHPVTANSKSSQSMPLEAWLSGQCGLEVTFYRAAYGALPDRQTKNSAAAILAAEGVQKHETILVGNEESDMRAGVNNKLLLVRPEWYASSLTYGFAVNTISELARFCELFGLREHPIFWSISEPGLQVRAMGPFSTMKPDLAVFGNSGKDAAKAGVGDTLFWFLMVVSSLYFSGVMHQTDYICRFPGHNPATPSFIDEEVDATLTILGKCSNQTYLPDLIIRHVASQKSQPIAAAARTFSNHLNTIHLNRHPRSYDGPPRRTPISLSGKTVLVADDICTSGRSLDVARAYIEAAGGQAILFSWLKTINTPFKHMVMNAVKAPFGPGRILGGAGSEHLSLRQPHHCPRCAGRDRSAAGGVQGMEVAVADSILTSLARSSSAFTLEGAHRSPPVGGIAFMRTNSAAPISASVAPSCPLGVFARRAVIAT